MALIYMALAFVLGLLIGPKYIKKLKKLKMGQYIREVGPDSHFSKSGTPTMGAGIFLIPALVFSIIFLDLNAVESWLLIGTMIAFAVIGGVDDFAKLVKKQNEGLTSKQKFLAQLIVSLVFILTYAFKIGDTTIWIPFIDKTWDLGWFYVLFMIFVVVGASNATNLTDGLDGLLSTNAIITFIGFAIVAIKIGDSNMQTFSWIMIGALLAFLVFNFNPAKVFMGDMGSLSLGALFAVMAMILKVEIVLVLLGAIYVLETLSVILQVASFKIFNRRIFKMSPVHHHFEMVGMKEKEIVFMFAAVQFVLVMIAALLI